MTGGFTGNRIELLRTGDEFFPALEVAIAAAREEVHLETYIFANDPTGHRVAGMLEAAARRGVAVHLLVDGFGAANIEDDWRERLEGAGVEVLVFRPEIGRWQLRRHRLRRMHRKLAVIDGSIGFCGGINVQDDRDGLATAAPRLDFAVRVTGPLVVDMHRAVRRLWLLVTWTTRGRPPIHLPPPATADPASAPGQKAAFLTRDNLRNRRAIEEAYLAAIEGARREIFIACAYFLPGQRFQDGLAAAVARGVRVRLLLQGVSDHAVLQYASLALYGRLMDAGIEIHQYFAAELHAKVAVIDGHWATVGSSNIDPFSLLLSREGNVVVEDDAFAAQLLAELEKALRDGAKPVLRESWARKPWPERLFAWLALRLARLLTGLTGYARGEEL